MRGGFAALTHEIDETAHSRGGFFMHSKSLTLSRFRSTFKSEARKKKMREAS